MPSSNNPIIKHRAGLLNLAQALKNVSCDTFYRYQELVEQGGFDALLNKDRRVANLKKQSR